MQSSEKNIRAFCSIGLVLGLMMMVAGYASVFRFQGSIWPGFPVRSNTAVAMVIFAAPEVQGALDGLVQGMRVARVNDVEVRTGQEVYELVGAMAAGTPVQYTLERGVTGDRRTFVVPTQEFSQATAYRVWLPLLGLGALFMGTLAMAVFVRTDSPAARALFMVGLGVASQYCFALPVLYFAHGYELLPQFFGFPTMAGVLTLSLVFPIARRPLRNFPRATMVVIWVLAASFVLGEVLWMNQPAQEFFWLEFVRQRLLLAGFVVLVGNVTWTTFRHGDPSVRGQASMFLRGLVLGGSTMVGLLLLHPFGGPGFAYLEPLVWASPLLIFSSSIAIGMLRYGLFGFGRDARRSLGRFSLFLVTLSVGYNGFAFVEIFLDTAAAWGIMFAFGLSVIGMVAIWPRAYRLIEGLLEAVLIPERQRARVMLESAAVEMSRIRDAEKIGLFVERTLGDALGAAWVRCLVGNSGQPLLDIVSHERAESIDTTSDLYGLVRDGGNLVSQPTGAPGGALAAAVGEARRREIALIASMPPREAFFGAVVCGPPTQSAPYTASDLALVKLLATSVAVALENARSWSEIQQLRTRLEQENLFLRAEVRSETELGELVGDSPRLHDAIAQIDAVAGTAASVLVVGETGVGKELAVRRLHRNSLRADKALVKVACAALPESLLESELFGFESGAFTGATQRRVGRFEVADGGTLFLDDVDTLPLSVQAKLLRAIQEGEVQRLGSNEVLHVDVRLVASTNRDLLEEVREGRFREDLYYRLNVVPIELPALRERKEDIPSLVAHFVQALGPSLGREISEISSATLSELQTYHWPGNIRELRNVVERALVMGRGPILQLPEGPITALAPPAADEVPLHTRVVSTPRRSEALGSAPLKELLLCHKKTLIEDALQQTQGNQAAAAKMLGVHRSNLNRMIKDLKVSIP